MTAWIGWKWSRDWQSLPDTCQQTFEELDGMSLLELAGFGARASVLLGLAVQIT